MQRFTNDDVAGAREAYSDYFLNELFDEVPKHLPDLNELLIVRFDRSWPIRSGAFRGALFFAPISC